MTELPELDHVVINTRFDMDRAWKLMEIIQVVFGTTLTPNCPRTPGNKITASKQGKHLGHPLIGYAIALLVAPSDLVESCGESFPGMPVLIPEFRHRFQQQHRFCQ